MSCLVLYLFSLQSFYSDHPGVRNPYDYLAKQLEVLRPEEACAARVLRDLVRNQRLG